MIYSILQGSKRVAIHDNLLNYDSEDYLTNFLELPLIGQFLIMRGAALRCGFACVGADQTGGISGSYAAGSRA